MNNLDYRELLSHFEEQRTKRQLEFKKEMEGIEETISGLTKMLGNQHQPVSLPAPHPVVTTAERYTGISVRWAILNLLGEDAHGPMSSAQIADTLKNGGIISNGQNFTSNVSAVISDMTNKRSELESTDSGYRLSENGRAAWNAIKHSAKYINRSSATAS